MPVFICQYVKTYITLLFCFIFPGALFAQPPNGCNVVAKMTPGGDSVLNAPAVINFQNASINATDYRFIYDGFAHTMNQPLTISIGAGLKIIKLVAYNGNCTDTAVAYYFYSGTFPPEINKAGRAYGRGERQFTMTGLETLSDQGNLIFGHRESSSYFNETQSGLLFKTMQTGCLEWSHSIPGQLYSGSTILAAKESVNGTIYLLPSLPDGPKYLTKLDASGNIIWTIGLKDGSNNYEYFTAMEPMPGGDVITVSVPSPSFTTFKVTRIDANGQVVWQKKYDYNTAAASSFNNLLIKDGFLYIAGYIGYNNDPASFGSFISKIDAGNGQTIWTREYKSGTISIKLGNMESAGSTIVLNFIGPTNNPLRSTIGGIMRIDTSGAVLSASLITEVFTPNSLFGPYGVSSSRLTKSGSNFYIITFGAYPLTLQGDGTKTKQIRLDSMLQVKWVKNSGGVGQPRYYFNAPAENEGAVIGGRLWGPALSESLYGLLFHIVPVDSAGGAPGSSCYFPEQNWEIIPPPVSVTDVQWTADAPASNTSVPLTITWDTYYPEMRYNCPVAYVDSCSFLKISGTASICNLTQTYTYKSHKNKACGQPTVWSLPPGTQIISLTDSSVSVKFLSFGRYVIYGKNVLGCVPAEDSITVIAASTTPPLNLGADFNICPGNNRTLHAGNRFFSYLWQDGSTDSVLTINQPGQYWVRVTDSCSNLLSDTVNISLAPPIPFTAGADRIICANDTVHLTATPGFQNYQWSPPYQVSATTGQSIIVNPLIDTTYTVTGEMTPGCFAYDTVRIIVNNVNAVNLGTDKNLCFGDSLVLDAGNGFASYMWSTGANTQLITARNLGLYSVIATAANNCKAYDTISILNVWPKPQLLLDKRTDLCFGTTRILDPGNFVSYLWNTGAVTRTITVNAVGLYAVQVSDSKGCKGTDTSTITAITPVPAGFLPADTAICSYGNIVITPAALFNTYLWSNGAIGQSLEIKKAGTYWLEVTNSKGCVGTDSIRVLSKDCQKGFFMPTAFTPNKDGKNDLLKPILFGNIKQYEFWIFNRLGQLVFQSKDPLKGWDGNYKELQQNGNAFVWICAYQFEGEPAIKKSGAFTLIR